MDWLSQSAVLSKTPEAFAHSLLSPARRIVLGEEGSHFRYWLEGGFREGAVVHYQMFVGLRRLSWEAVVTRAREESYLETELAFSPTSPFRDFSAVHYFRPFREERTLVRDEMEFDATAEITHFLKSGWSTTVGESPSEGEEQTGEMRLFGSELG